MEVLDEVVVVGYGSQLKKTVTGAISSVKAKELEAPNAVSADNLLQGKVAGLSITQNSAQPGSGMSVNIRGALSPNGSNSPLYVTISNKRYGQYCIRRDFQSKPTF